MPPFRSRRPLVQEQARLVESSPCHQELRACRVDRIPRPLPIDHPLAPRERPRLIEEPMRPVEIPRADLHPREPNQRPWGQRRDGMGLRPHRFL